MRKSAYQKLLIRNLPQYYMLEKGLEVMKNTKILIAMAKNSFLERRLE